MSQRRRDAKVGTGTRVLLVEDTPSLCLVYSEYLRKAGYSVEAVETGKAALNALAEEPLPQLVLLDLQLPDVNGMEVLNKVSERELPVAVVVITSNASIKVAVEAMQAGAYDFLVKPASADRLLVTVRNAVERLRLLSMVDELREDLGRDRFQGFIGSSLQMQAVYRMIEAAAASPATVFITGESGTGKEVCAEAIHKASPRRNGRFVALNCGAIPKDLMESEIFGHLKGSFTGAIADRPGAAKEADGGTLFLDEICEMSPDLQTKLLRFIQTGQIQRVGSARPEAVDVRFVCATNRDPWVEVEAGRFREDLYYRLHVIPIHLPPLRERADDVVEIARALLVEYAREEGKRFKRLAPETEARLRGYQWPGNVRQLQNVLRRAVVLHDAEVMAPDMLPTPLDTPTDAGDRRGGAETPTGDEAAAAPIPASHGPPVYGEEGDSGGIKPLWQVEREAIEAAIAACDGNIPRAASLLQVAPSTIYRKKAAWDAGDD